MSDKVYKVGQSVYFKKPDHGRGWGKVTAADPHGNTWLYMIKEEGSGIGHLLRPSAIIDLEQVSADASAALERISRRDRARGDLLMELLGRLSYMAEHRGNIDYLVDGSWHNEQLQPIIDEFLDRVKAL